MKRCGTFRIHFDDSKIYGNSTRSINIETYGHADPCILSLNQDKKIASGEYF